MAKQAPYTNEADYVVVGSGSSGAAVAGRLAQSGASVIVLEAGKSDEQFLVKKPGMIGPMHAEPKIKAKVDWGYYSTPQEHLLNRRMPVPRGKVVGGSSSINGMVYVRGNRANYDSWAAEGNTGWDADSVNAAYKRMEDFEDGANDFRGAGGPIKITRNKTPQEGTLQFIQATSDALGVKVLDDYNADAQEGISRMQQNAADGLRYSASRGYIHNLDVPTLELQSEVLVTKIVIENGRAVGVAVVDKDGSTRIVRAGKEVILSAGFVGSAQLLMLSGIGHAEHLSRERHHHDRRPPGRRQPARPHVPRADLPRDHVDDEGQRLVLRQGRRQGAAAARQDVPGQLGLRVGRLRARPPQATDVPDLQLHLLPWSYVSPNQDEPIRHDVDPRPALTVLATLIYPKSRGTLRLASGDPMAGSADRLPLPLRPGRPRGARRGVGDGPRDHGRRRVRRDRQGRDPPGCAAAGAGPAPRDPQPGDVGLPRCRHLPDGRRRPRRRRSRPQGPRRSTASAWPTPRSCRPSPVATPTHPRS